MNGTGAGHQAGIYLCGQASLQLPFPSNLALFVSSLPPGPIIPAKPLPNTMFKLASLHPECETWTFLIEVLELQSHLVMSVPAMGARLSNTKEPVIT